MSVFLWIAVAVIVSCVAVDNENEAHADGSTVASATATATAAAVALASVAAQQFRGWLSSTLPKKSVIEIDSLAAALQADDLGSIDELSNLQHEDWIEIQKEQGLSRGHRAALQTAVKKAMSVPDAKKPCVRDENADGETHDAGAGSAVNSISTDLPAVSTEPVSTATAIEVPPQTAAATPVPVPSPIKTSNATTEGDVQTFASVEDDVWCATWEKKLQECCRHNSSVVCKEGRCRYCNCTASEQDERNFAVAYAIHTTHSQIPARNGTEQCHNAMDAMPQCQVAKHAIPHAMPHAMPQCRNATMPTALRSHIHPIPTQFHGIECPLTSPS